MSETEAVAKRTVTGSLGVVETAKNIEHVRMLLDLQGEEVDVLSLARGNMVMICRGSSDCVYKDTCGFCRQNAPAQPPVGEYCPLPSFAVLLGSATSICGRCRGRGLRGGL